MGMGDPFEPKIWKYPINANKKYNKKKIGGYVSDPLQASNTSHGVKMHGRKRGVFSVGALSFSAEYVVN